MMMMIISVTGIISINCTVHMTSRHGIMCHHRANSECILGLKKMVEVAKALRKTQ